MTSYSFGLRINDSEMIALQAAIAHYADHCRSKIQERSGAPYHAHVHTLEEISRRLFDDPSENFIRDMKGPS
jgi:hypothetical protein